MRRSPYIILALLLAVSMLAGCGGQSAQTGKPNATVTETTGSQPPAQQEVEARQEAQPEPEPEPEPEPVEDEPVEGGTTDSTDANAPKTISSTEIVSFACVFSTTSLVDPPSSLGWRLFTLSAVLENGVVSGQYGATDSPLDGKPLLAGPVFMEKLQAIVQEYDLAQYNGLYRETHGLPDMFGAELQVRYASGEEIYAYNNQDCFLPLDAMAALNDLFQDACVGEPTSISLSSSTVYDSDWGENYSVGVSCPQLRPGVPGWGSEFEPAIGLDALTETLDSYNYAQTERMSEELALLKEEAESVQAEDYIYLHAENQAFVTRCDTAVVSFYGKTVEQFTDEEYRGYYSVTLDTMSGELLGWNDVFTDLDALPALIAGAVREKYYGLEFPADLEELIAEFIEWDNPYFSFALGENCVHITSDWGELNEETTGVHITLFYDDYPELVLPVYRKSARESLLPMEYASDYRTAAGSPFSMVWSEGENEEGDWTLYGDGWNYSESFFGYAPECYLVRKEDRSFIYLRIPVGDVSMYTKVYEVTGQGVRDLGTVDLAMANDAVLDPEYMLMSSNDFLYGGPLFTIPTTVYRVGDDGLPEKYGVDYSLSGSTVALLNEGDFTQVDPRNGASTLGSVHLPAGTLLDPLRTDLSSYLDMITKDGVAIRITMDCVSPLLLDGYQDPEDLFDYDWLY